MRVLTRGVFSGKRKPAFIDRFISLLGEELFLFLGFLGLVSNLRESFFSSLSLGFFEKVVLLLIAEHRFSLGRVHDEIDTINDEDKEERENNRQSEEDGVILEGSDEWSIEIEVLLVVRIRIDGDHDPNRND